jgi:hypothetical protein
MFFLRATAFYDRNLKNLSIPRRIQVAILDTGVDMNNSIFSSPRRKTRIKAVRVFVKDSLGHDGRITFNDASGHGTNVAGLVLRLAPETDLYIAKISKGSELDSKDSIAEVFIWPAYKRAFIC